MTAGQRRALSNLAYSERFTLYEDRMNEEEVRQREILGECSPHVLAAISSKIRNIIRDDPRHTWYEPVVPISAVAVQAVLRWAEDQCTSGAPHVSHIDMTPLYADNIVSVVKLATVIGISYTLMGVREAAVQYCNHYGSGAANELLMVAQQRRCPTLEAVLRPFCT